MSHHDSATRNAAHPLPTGGSGLRWALLGVVAFSFTVPFTRVAVAGLSPLFVGAGRAVVAAVLAGLCLSLARSARPRGVQWWRLAVVGGGVVVGFPLLTTFALQSSTASRGAVVIALLPAATAVVSVLRTGARVPPRFWAAAAAGASAALVVASVQPGGLSGPTWADLLLLAAVLAAAVGYAEGGLLAGELGAWQTISWALLLCAPVMVTLTAVTVQRELPGATPVQWLAFGYLGVISMFLGMVAWYRGLGLGPMPQVSQVQLGQPALSIIWSALLLGEQLSASTVVGGVAVVACVALAVRARQPARHDTVTPVCASTPGPVTRTPPRADRRGAPNRDPDPPSRG